MANRHKTIIGTWWYHRIVLPYVKKCLYVKLLTTTCIPNLTNLRSSITAYALCCRRKIPKKLATMIAITVMCSNCRKLSDKRDIYLLVYIFSVSPMQVTVVDTNCWHVYLAQGRLTLKRDKFHFQTLFISKYCHSMLVH